MCLISIDFLTVSFIDCSQLCYSMQRERFHSVSARRIGVTDTEVKATSAETTANRGSLFKPGVGHTTTALRGPATTRNEPFLISAFSSH